MPGSGIVAAMKHPAKPPANKQLLASFHDTLADALDWRINQMRLPILIFLAAVTLMGEPLATSAQRADQYPWCSLDSGGVSGGSGAKICAYATREQCVATQSGIGGTCFQNLQYRPAATPPAGSRRARKHPS